MAALMRMEYLYIHEENQESSMPAPQPSINLLMSMSFLRSKKIHMGVKAAISPSFTIHNKLVFQMA